MPTRSGRAVLMAPMLTALVLGSTARAHAQGTDFHQGQTFPKVVEHGKRITLGYFYELNPDCSSVGDFHVYVTSPPRGGQVTFAQTRDFPTYPPTNNKYKCDLKRANVTKVFYQARRDFMGLDAFGLQSVTSSGTPIDFNIQVSVR